jgi:hypothetical protein
VTEEEFQQAARQFIQQLPNYPQVGKRPFGYPKGAWWMSGLWAFLGMVLQLPLVLIDGLDRWQVVASVSGAILFCCAFTLRVVAFTSAAGGSVDRWLIERLGTVGSGAEQSDPPKSPVGRES